MNPTPRNPARPRSRLDAVLALQRRPVGCGRGKDAVVNRAGLANEASPLQLGFRDKSDDFAHVLSSVRSLGCITSQMRRLCQWAEWRVSAGPRANPVCAASTHRRAGPMAAATRSNIAEISGGCDGGHVGTRTRVNGFADRRVTTPPRGPNEGGAI